MIKVLHYGLSSHLGGIETYLYKLNSNINKQEYRFDFVVVGDEEPCWYKEFIASGSSFYKVVPASKSPLKNKRELYNLLSEKKFDIVHCHLNSLSNINIINAALKNNIPVIVHSRNAGIVKSPIYSLLHNINYYLLPRKRIKMLSVSRKAGEWMFGERNNFEVINNGIDISKFKYNQNDRESFRQELNIAADEVVIVHLGAMRIQKNHMFLLNIFSEVLKVNKKAKLILVGDGELKNDIEKKIDEIDARDSVILLGCRNDIPRILSAADKFLFPSLYEGFPNAVLEAQTSGLPCLVSDVITNEVIINDNCKALSLTESAVKWAKEIMTLPEYSDRNIAVENIEEKGFSVRNEIKRIEEVYHQVIR